MRYSVRGKFRPSLNSTPSESKLQHFGRTVIRTGSASLAVFSSLANETDLQAEGFSSGTLPLNGTAITQSNPNRLNATFNETANLNATHIPLQFNLTATPEDTLVRPYQVTSTANPDATNVSPVLEATVNGGQTTLSPVPRDPHLDARTFDLFIEDSMSKQQPCMVLFHPAQGITEELQKAWHDAIRVAGRRMKFASIQTDDDGIGHRYQFTRPTVAVFDHDKMYQIELDEAGKWRGVFVLRKEEHQSLEYLKEFAAGDYMRVLHRDIPAAPTPVVFDRYFDYLQVLGKKVWIVSIDRGTNAKYIPEESLKTLAAALEGRGKAARMESSLLGKLYDLSDGTPSAVIFIDGTAYPYTGAADLDSWIAASTGTEHLGLGKPLVLRSLKLSTKSYKEYIQAHCRTDEGCLLKLYKSEDNADDGLPFSSKYIMNIATLDVSRIRPDALFGVTQFPAYLLIKLGYVYKLQGNPSKDEITGFIQGGYRQSERQKLDLSFQWKEVAARDFNNFAKNVQRPTLVAFMRENTPLPPNFSLDPQEMPDSVDLVWVDPSDSDILRTHGMDGIPSFGMIYGKKFYPYPDDELDLTVIDLYSFVQCFGNQSWDQHPWCRDPALADMQPLPLEYSPATEMWAKTFEADLQKCMTEKKKCFVMFANPSKSYGKERVVWDTVADASKNSTTLNVGVLAGKGSKDTFAKYWIPEDGSIAYRLFDKGYMYNFEGEPTKENLIAFAKKAHDPSQGFMVPSLARKILQESAIPTNATINAADSTVLAEAKAALQSEYSVIELDSKTYDPVVQALEKQDHPFLFVMDSTLSTKDRQRFNKLAKKLKMKVLFSSDKALQHRLGIFSFPVLSVFFKGSNRFIEQRAVYNDDAIVKFVQDEMSRLRGLGKLSPPRETVTDTPQDMGAQIEAVKALNPNLTSLQLYALALAQKANALQIATPAKKESEALRIRNKYRRKSSRPVGRNANRKLVKKLPTSKPQRRAKKTSKSSNRSSKKRGRPTTRRRH